MEFFRSRKSYFLNLAILCVFLGGWIFSYLSPVLKGLMQEDDYVLYGTVSRASVPSIFGGSDIPFFDKVKFQINEDENAEFILYASQEILDEMSEWFSFGAVDAGSIPLEIEAARLEGDKFVVHSLASTYGELDFDTLVLDYQVYYAFVETCVVVVFALLAIVFFILWLVKKRRSA